MGIPKVSQFHVLAVDDSIIDRKLIERLLKNSSFKVTTVDSASKALEFLGVDDNEQTNLDQSSVSPKNHQEVQVNLIITDYCMPGMTGYDLLKRVKESSSLRNIPVVIMSSENVPSRINRCLEEGAEEFFLKPVKLSDVNKLKPHMMKTRRQNQEQEEQNQEAESVKTEEVVQSLQQILVPPPPPPPPPPNSNSNINCSSSCSNNNNDVNNNNNNNNNIKNYKAIEGGLGEDRTRHSRYSGLTVA